MSVVSVLLLSVSSVNAKEVEYKNLYYLSESNADNLLGFDPNKKGITEEEIQIAVNNFYAQGYFQNIFVEKENGKIILNFQEKSPIASILMRGYKENLEKTELEEFLRIKMGEFYELGKIEIAKKLILKELSEEGRVDSKVTVKKKNLENGTVSIVFEINLGIIKTIEKINLNGFNVLNYDDIEPVIVNKEHEFLGWFWGRNDGKFKEFELPNDNLRIKELYLSKGYLDAKLIEPKYSDINKEEIELSLSVQEGEQYSLSEINININSDDFDKKLIKEKLLLKEGGIFNVSNLRHDVEKIKLHIGSKGYAFAQVSPKVNKVPEENNMRIEYDINPGNKVFIRDVKIQGNTRTMDAVIRRELFLATGDIYSKSEIEASKRSLGRTGYFEKYEIEEKKVGRNKMDLIVTVKETKTGNLQIGGGYGSYGGFLGTLSVNDMNLFGSGITSGMRLEKSQMTESYSFNLSNPKLNDSDYSGNFSVFSNDNQYNDYTIESKGFTAGIGKRLTRHLQAYVGYSLNSTDYSNYLENSIASEYTYFFESFEKSAVNAMIVYNSTDDFYIAHDGIHSTLSFEKAGLGGEADFVKTRFDFNFYYPLKEYINSDWIFRYKSKFNYVHDTGYVPLSDTFYLGGLNSVRGYEAYSLSPTIVNNDGSTTRTGGTKSVINTIELSVPINGNKLRGVVYADWGFVGYDKLNEISRGGYGVGIEWMSPMGPLKFMYSKPLNSKPGDTIANFEFSFGQQF